MKRILIADNDRNLLKVFAALLKQGGYDVLTAADAKDAERALRESHIHLAILDVRLNDDFDKLDKSGLILAKKEAYSRVPKIILTNFPDYLIVRESLADSVEGQPAAVDFLAKEQKATEWIETVHQAFRKHVKVNWNLKVSASESSPGFTQICEFVSPGFKGEDLSERSTEIEEVFQRLFYDDDEIRIDKLLWKSGDRVALGVFSFSKQRLPQGFVVICGPRKATHEEVSRFAKYRPKDSGLGQTILERSAETVHFGGACYTLAGASLEELQPLRDVYVTNEKSFHAASKTLFGKTLRFWHDGSRLVEEESGLDGIYREHLGLGLARRDQERFKAKVESLASRLPMIGMRCEFSDSAIMLNISGQVMSYPDPLATLYGAFDFPRPVPMIITPGAISADTVFAAGSDGPWLTDFAMAGPAPLTWNHVELEAAVRFDLVRSTNLKWTYQMEQALVEGDFSRFYAEDMEGSLKKAVKAIQVIRKDAAGGIGAEVASYHLGIFFEAARRLAAYNPDAPMRDKEMAPFAHLLLAMCMIGAHLRDKRAPTKASVRSADAIEIDRDNRRVLVEGVPITLRGNGYRLLCFLYDRAGRLCDRKQLFEAVFDETYDPADENQQSKLNTAIHRLRERIEDDAEDPKYVLTDSGGYRLVME